MAPYGGVVRQTDDLVQSPGLISSGLAAYISFTLRQTVAVDTPSFSATTAIEAPALSNDRISISDTLAEGRPRRLPFLIFPRRGCEITISVARSTPRRFTTCKHQSSFPENSAFTNIVLLRTILGA